MTSADELLTISELALILGHNRNAARPCIRAREIYKTNNLAKAVDVYADRFLGRLLI